MIDEFVKEPFFERLAARKEGFKFIVDHLSKISVPSYIIETGTARIEGNWEGDGQSTLIWDWCLERNPALKCLSIDLYQEYVDIAKSQTKKVEFICSDSIKALSEMDESIVRNTRLLYLDSFDWSPDMHLESAFHHMCELSAVWKLLPDDCLIVVDDCHGPLQGKHVMVQYYLAKLLKSPAFAGYQTGWFKSK
jgi:hypothetical protein